MDTIHSSHMDAITEKYMLLVEKVSNTTKNHKSFNTDVNIYRGEIHIIQLIGDRSELHISEISRLIGVTKGTVSQIVKRLENKGLVQKHIDSENNTRQIATLTQKGITAYKAHLEYHNRKHAEMKRFLDTLTADERHLIERFLEEAHDMIEDHL